MEAIEFWISVEDECPELSAKARLVLIPFAMSYLCEAEFSAVTMIKSKFHVKMYVEHEMSVEVSV